MFAEGFVNLTVIIKEIKKNKMHISAPLIKLYSPSSVSKS